MAKKFERVEVEADELLLDVDNPRFGLKKAGTQDVALEMLVRNGKLKELWDSINSQGWIDFEPLVGLSQKKDGKYIVIEGNRRVAAIQTLLEPDRLVAALAKRVPPMSQLAKDTIKDIELMLVDDRHQADAFIGFKHVNGPASWGSLAKAKFADGMFDRATADGKSPDEALESIQDALGDANTTSILRSLMAYRIFTQAIENDFVSDEMLDEGVTGFSHLYTMMPNPPTRGFLGLGEQPVSAASITTSPVPITHLEQLNLMIGWLFGNEKAKKVIQSQGTDRPTLQKVMASSSATNTLIATGSLVEAKSELGIEVDDWRNRLTRLEKQAKDLATDLFSIQDDIGVEQSKDAHRRAVAAQRACKSMAQTLSVHTDQADLFGED